MSPREPEGPTAEDIGLDPSTVIQRSPLDPPSDPGPPVSMSDLPSRAVAQGILDSTYDLDNGARIVADILRLAASGRLFVFCDDEREDMIRSLTATLDFMIDYPETNDGYAEIQRLRERMRQQRVAIGDIG